jgi:hypothetical protein
MSLLDACKIWALFLKKNQITNLKERKHELFKKKQKINNNAYHRPYAAGDA